MKEATNDEPAVTTTDAVTDRATAATVGTESDLPSNTLTNNHPSVVQAENAIEQTNLPENPPGQNKHDGEVSKPQSGSNSNESSS